MRAYGGFAVALTAALAMPLAPTAQACIPAGQAALLILDASYSMLRPDRSNGPARFTFARSAVATMVDTFPDTGYLALRFYGSQTRDSCTDTNLSVRFAPALENRNAIKLALANSHARGLTPIAYALEQAAGDFTDEDIGKNIIMVSDGLETCEGDPCAVAAKLATRGFVIHTVGFLVGGGQRAQILARHQLQCIAEATGGTYVDAPVAIGLSDRLREAFSECPVAVLPRSFDDWDTIAAG